MLFKSLFSAGAALAAMISTVNADVSPNYPGPGTVWTAGKPYAITWDVTTASTGDWSNFTIDFMTGDNLNMVKLETVASGLDGSKATSYTWTAPAVDPYSAIYFFQFTPATGAAAWTTRFAIVAKEGDTPAAEPNRTQPGGEAIPWGVGKLAAAVPTTSAVETTTAATSASTSAAESQSSSETSPLAAEEPTSKPSSATKKDDGSAGVMTTPSKITMVGTSALMVLAWAFA